MTEAKTIKLLLSNGSLSGLLIAELSKWDGILFSSPRNSYQLLMDELETKFWGVYLLVSDHQVYIGQANDLMRRINEHDKTKSWWNRVILLTTKDNSLNRSDIDYIENKMIRIAKSNGTLDMSNIQPGNAPKVTRYREAELFDYLEGGLLLLELIGIKVFNNVHTKTKIGGNPPTVTNVNDEQNNIVTFNKGKIINYLRVNENLFLNDGEITYASLQEGNNSYWANPRVDLLQSKWYLILNNQITREIKVLEIPAKSLEIGKEGYGLVIRKDKPYYIDLNINHDDLIDLRSKRNFTKFLKYTCKY